MSPPRARRTLDANAGRCIVKKSVGILAGFAALLVAVPAASEPAERSATLVTPPASAFMPRGMLGPRQLVFFGYVRSLVRNDNTYLARIDPSLVLTGVTASTAAVEDKVLQPGEPVPNDYYERNESKRPLTYRVDPRAHVTVLVNPGIGPRSAVVSVSEFVQIVKGKNPRNRPGLWGPASGFWIRVQSDRALAFDQAYRP
jgi:hypothetical protein